MSELSDRRVHATLGNAEIVRYDRAGKWYYESDDYRRKLTVDEAVQFIPSQEHVRFGVPGGSAFDRKVRARFKRADDE